MNPLIFVQAIFAIVKKMGSVAGTLAMVAAFAAFVASFSALALVVRKFTVALPPYLICALSAGGFFACFKLAMSMLSAALTVRFARFIAARASSFLES